MLQLGGRCFRLVGTTRSGRNGSRSRAMFVSGRLAQGRYFMTLRLEDRKTENLFFPVDKQTGLMSFEVLRQRRDFLGAVDLGMQCSEVAMP